MSTNAQMHQQQDAQQPLQQEQLAMDQQQQQQAGMRQQSQPIPTAAILPDVQQNQPEQHREPAPAQEPPQQQGAAPARVHGQHGGAVVPLRLAPPEQPVCDQLMVLGSELASPNPFRPRSFITSDASVSPARKKPKRLSVDVTDKDAQGLSTPARGQQSDIPPPSSGAGLGTGTMAAMLAAEAGRSAALERYSSISLLSPTGSLFMGPMKTPRLSAILSADMEPQAPQDAAGSAGAAGGMWSPVAGDMRLSHGAVNPAGGKQSISAARFDDRCTEVCEAAQAVAMSSPDQDGGPSLAALQQWQQTIEAAELQWGPSHPAVGRAWLELARALQAADKDSDRAKHATKKAFDICQILLKQTGTESHAQESFEYLLAKFNTKATAAKQAAAADSAREAATAEALSVATSAAAAAAAPAPPTSLCMPQLSVSAPVSLPFASQQLGSAAPTASAASTADQMQLPCMQPSYMLYPPSAQHLGMGGYPMPHMALQALGGMQGLGGLQSMQAAGSPAAQYMAADMQATALMSCGYLPHSAAMLLHGAGTPTADCLSLMQPSLLFGSPAAMHHAAVAGAAGAFQPQLPPAAAAASSSQQDRTPKKRKHSAAAASRAGKPGSAAKAKASALPQPAGSSDKSAAGGDNVCDQEQGAAPKARMVLNL